MKRDLVIAAFIGLGGRRRGVVFGRFGRESRPVGDGACALWLFQLKRKNKMNRIWLFVGVGALFGAVLLGVWRAEAQVAQTRRFVITDLPPSVARSAANPNWKRIFLWMPRPLELQSCGCVSSMARPALCRAIHSINSAIPAMAAAAVCWRQFISSLTAAGIAVLVAPAVGGASYSFNLGGAGAPRRSCRVLWLVRPAAIIG